MLNMAFEYQNVLYIANFCHRFLFWEHISSLCNKQTLLQRSLPNTLQMHISLTIFTRQIRGAEHMADYKNARSNIVLLKHKLNEHQQEEMRLKMKITRKFKDTLTRRANEAVRIRQRNKNKCKLLNSKSEFNHPPLGRIVVEKRNFVKTNATNRLQHRNTNHN